MAIISCKECGGQVSDTAATCPHCGAAVGKPQVVAIEKKSGNVWPWLVFGVMMFFVVITIFASIGSRTPSEQTAARRAYEGCMDSLKADDRARAGNGSFIAGTCEMMRNKYIEKYRSTP